MTKEDGTRAGNLKPARFGLRIGVIFFIALSILIIAAYVVVSHNVQDMLTDYTLQLMQSMVQEGVTTVEYELRVSRDQAAELAGFISDADGGDGDVLFPEDAFSPDILRMVYVTRDSVAASDGRQRDIRGRKDIFDAFSGKPGIFGPCFNEEDEYVICYSAPVIRDNETVGVLSIEKDGYYFSSLIKNIRFMDTGESYIIDAGGTDIAVSNQNHMEWVDGQYNAGRLLTEQEDSVTRSIMELEQKGLDGETGIGTYYWDDGLCYLFYAPVPTTGWVLLLGLREEELAFMTQSALFTSATGSPVFSVCIAVFLLLAVIVIYWIVSSFKKNLEINKKLNIKANYDSLTGTLNRNSFHEALDALPNSGYDSLACIYIDANGLHEINNHLGHQAGDNMLKTVVEKLQQIFQPDNVYRIGGDEFVVFCQNRNEQEVYSQTEAVRKALREHGYEISIGIEWRDSRMDIKTMVNMAEESMKFDKERYYQDNGGERQMRDLDRKIEKMVLEKQDADTFLSILAPEFKGVYFVDLGNNTIRHLYIPCYFEEMLSEADDVFSKALTIYAERAVMNGYREEFERFCDFETVEKKLDSKVTPELIYQKTDGSWLKLRILKFKTYTRQCRETLWIFSNTDRP